MHCGEHCRIVLKHVVQKIKTDVPKDISLAEAGKYGSLTDFAFFDKVSARTAVSVAPRFTDGLCVL